MKKLIATLAAALFCVTAASAHPRYRAHEAGIRVQFGNNTQNIIRPKTYDPGNCWAFERLPYPLYPGQVGFLNQVQYTGRCGPRPLPWTVVYTTVTGAQCEASVYYTQGNVFPYVLSTRGYNVGCQDTTPNGFPSSYHLVVTGPAVL
jgi:hypothetical protein